MSKSISRLIIAFILVLKAIYCNIWDNMFSQMDSPGYIVPNEFNATFAKNSTPDTPLFSISASSKLNLIKLSFYEQPALNMSSFTDIANSGLKFLAEDNTNSKTNSNSKDNNKVKILKKNPIVSAYLNFTNGTVVIDVPGYNCTWKNVSALKFLTTKFVLVSYDILTYYRIVDNMHNFIFTNPVGSRTNDSLSIFSSPIQWFKDFLSDIDLASIVVFKVNPEKNLLENVDIRFKNYDLLYLNAEVNIFDKPDKADYYFDKTCTEDITPNITQSIYSLYDSSKVKSENTPKNLK